MRAADDVAAELSSAVTTTRLRAGIAIVPVLQRLGSFEQHRVGWPVSGDWSVLGSGRHDEQVPGAEVDRVPALHLDHKRAGPAEEELVLVVMVKREGALEARQADYGVVRADKVLGLPRFRQRAD